MAESHPDDQESDDQLLATYRHDAHKLTGESHARASETLAGVPVNRPVPHGADADAAALSRPGGQPEQTVDAHGTHYRLSLLDGNCCYESDEFAGASLSGAFGDLLTDSNPERLHRTWLTSSVASGFNESVYFPFTSLKYHTLLAAALVDSYRDGHEFADLHLVFDPADEIVHHRTIYADEDFALRIDGAHGDRPSARLGSRPWQSWASVWSRLPAHPLETDTGTFDMVLDANLRRIGSWSTALQDIEDFTEAFDR